MSENIENTTTIEEKTSAQEPEKTQNTTDSANTVETPVETIQEPEIKIVEKKPLFHFRSKDSATFSRDEWILQNLKSEDLMEYLRLEQHRMELLQEAKDIKGRRILKAFELTVSLAAISIITYLLKDNPTILISILYTTGIIGAFWLWKKPNNKDDNK